MYTVCTAEGCYIQTPPTYIRGLDVPVVLIIINLDVQCYYYAGDCGAPHPPLNGYVESYNSSVEWRGAVFYQCREELQS